MKIFISYRREDSQYQADRLHAALKEQVGDHELDVFIDVDNIPLGVDFDTFLNRKVGECDILLALIGPRWCDSVDPESGRRRLDDETDFVRIEIAAALKRGIPVVPVLLDGAQVPKKDSLPENLRPLVTKNATSLQRISFEADTARLLERLPITPRHQTAGAQQDAALTPSPRPLDADWRSGFHVVAPDNLSVSNGGIDLYYGEGSNGYWPLRIQKNLVSGWTVRSGNMGGAMWEVLFRSEVKVPLKLSRGSKMHDGEILKKDKKFNAVFKMHWRGDEGHADLSIDGKFIHKIPLIKRF